MEYGTRDVGHETAAAVATASNDEARSCAGSSRSRSSSRRPSRSSSCSSGRSGGSATSDWPLENNLALAAAAAGLGLHQPPSGAALLLNSLYSLHAMHSGRGLWHEARDGDEENKEQQQEHNEVRQFLNNWKEETSAVGEMPMLSSWMLSAYASMLGRLWAAAPCGSAALEPDCSDIESRSSEHSSASPDTKDFPRSRDSSPSCSLQKQSPAKRKRSRPAATTAKRAKKKRTSDQCKQEPTSSEAATSTSTDTTTTTTGGGRKRGLQALQRVRYRYEREEYRCGLCSYACTIEKAFERHLRAHARGQAHESRVSCAVCGADRSSELDLSKHMRRHRDNRYFCCDICIFRTVQLKKLIQHRRMHTGEKPHLCPHCSYRSARRDNLRSHVRRVHKKENLYQDTFSPRAPSFLKQQIRLDEEPPEQSDCPEPSSPAPSSPAPEPDATESDEAVSSPSPSPH